MKANIMSSQPLILVIDDETAILNTLKETLEDEGYRIETLSDGNRSIEIIGKLIPDLILLDIFMPNCNGINILEQIKKEYPQQKVIMISGFGNISIAIESIKKGALNFIEKPLNLDEILSKISFIKEQKEISTKNILRNKKEELINYLKNYNIIGNSYLFLELIQQINQIINLEFPLLIYGEHGTGKTLLIQYIHQNSNLRNEDLITIDCSALQETEVILNIKDFYLNKKGIIYIKHINNLTLNAQKKLLTIINDKKQKNQRLIASSLTSIFKLVESGLFNSTLYHKLNITPLEIPSLNKRKYDIPLLIDFFLKKENKKHNKSINLNTKSIRLLRNNYWQGNVAQLKNLIEQIVIQSKDPDDIIDTQNIINLLGEKEVPLLEEQSFLRFSSLKEAANEFEKNFLLFLLKKNKNDIKQTSNGLDLTPVQLRDKLLKFNIELK